MHIGDSPEQAWSRMRTPQTTWRLRDGILAAWPVVVWIAGVLVWNASITNYEYIPWLRAALLAVFAIVAAVAATWWPSALWTLWFPLLPLWSLAVWRAAPVDSWMSPLAHPFLFRGIGLPGAFLKWSGYGLPLFQVGRARLAQRGHPVPSRWALAVWLGLLVIARYLDGIAWDVLPTPFSEHGVALFSAVVLLPAPVLASALAANSVRRLGVVAPLPPDA